jgi:hypothetical protein
MGVLEFGQVFRVLIKLRKNEGVILSWQTPLTVRRPVLLNTF